MSRDPRYQRLLNDKRWWGDGGVKVQVWRRAGGLCEECHRVIVGQGDCHHVIPVETGRTVQEMERLCYDINNVRLLCVPCHIKVHQDMRTHTKEKVRENKKRRSQRFLEANDPNFVSEREQDDACISHAEREQSRTKCKYQPPDPST